MVRDMAKVCFKMQMALNTKAGGEMIREMELVVSYPPIVATFMMETGLMI